MSIFVGLCLSIYLSIYLYLYLYLYLLPASARTKDRLERHRLAVNYKMGTESETKTETGDTGTWSRCIFVGMFESISSIYICTYRSQLAALSRKPTEGWGVSASHQPKGWTEKKTPQGGEGWVPVINQHPPGPSLCVEKTVSKLRECGGGWHLYRYGAKVFTPTRFNNLA